MHSNFLYGSYFSINSCMSAVFIQKITRKTFCLAYITSKEHGLITSNDIV